MSKKVLVVGQTPPPHHGQAIMVEKMLEGDYGDVELVHVRMGFSEDVDEVGKLNAGLALHKIIELARVVGRIIRARFLEQPDALWYPPAGPDIIPVVRDMVILLATRWLFPKTVFHFHAGGLSTLYDELPSPLRPLFRAAFFRPDAAIRISEQTPEDGRRLQARQEFIVPNGMEDACEAREADTAQNWTAGPSDSAVAILFVGALCRSKGVMTLLRACKHLSEKRDAFTVRLMGRFESEAFKREVDDYLERHGLEEHVTFLGVLSGGEKWDAFANADVFCFPSYYESETFGLVLVEAFCFGLPVVATRWRGIPTVVGEDGDCGFLVQTKDPDAVADRLERLICDPALRREMGERARQRYLDHFTIKQFQENMADVFREVVSPLDQ